MTIGEKIFKLREAKGWNRAELSRRLGKADCYISNLETQEGSIPSLSALNAIAKELGVPAAFLIDDTQEDYVPEGSSIMLLYSRLDAESKKAFWGVMTMYVNLQVERNQRLAKEKSGELPFKG